MNVSSRRDFLKTTGALAAAACVSGPLRAESLHFPIGLQLYSVRELLPKNFDGTLKQLSAAGYQVVEAAGYMNKSAADWKKSMDQAGLKCVSSHHALGLLKSDGDKLIEYGKSIGLEYMICSWAGMHRDPADQSKDLSLDDWRWVADQFNAIGEKVKAAGMTFGYHNHTVEFGTEGDTMFFDELLKKTDPKYVVFEMDCGWVTAAGQDPVKYLKASPERFPLLHVKDMKKQEDGKWDSVVMGQGVAQYKPIFEAATALKYYFIEQEEFTGDPMTALREDANYMKKLSV